MKKSKKEINRCALIFFLLLFLGDWFAAIIKIDILLRHFHVIMVLLNVCDALLLKNTESFWMQYQALQFVVNTFITGFYIDNWSQRVFVQ